jgi:hypothetical protein
LRARAFSPLCAHRNKQTATRGRVESTPVNKKKRKKKKKQMQFAFAAIKFPHTTFRTQLAFD